MKKNSRTKIELLRDLNSLRRQIRQLEIDGKKKDRADKRVRRALVWHKALLERSPNAIVVTDSESRIILVNSSACTLTEYSRKQLSAKHLYDLCGGIQRSEFRKKINSVIAGEIVVHKTHLRRGDGKEMEAEFDCRCIDNEGKPYIISTIRNLTGRKQIERELTVLDYAMSSISDAITITDEHNTIIFVNDTFLRMYGYTREELIGSPIHILRFEETMPPVEEVSMQTLKDGWQGELINRRKDGSTFPIWLSTSAVRDENGMLLGLIGITTDITQRKRAEEALQESEERYRTLITNQEEGIAIVDLKEYFVFTNPAGERIFGVSPGTLVGRNLAEFVDPEQMEFIAKETEKRIRGERSTYEMEIKLPNGERRSILVTGNTQFEKDGQVVGTFGIFHDITDHKKAEKARKEAETALRESRDQLRKLAARLETTREEERKYIAHEMHEEFAQVLSAIKLHMSDFSVKYSHDKEFVAGVVELSGFIDGVIQSIRKISTQLRPGVLDLLGLTAAIEWQAKEFSKQYNIACDIDVPQERIQLQEQSSIILFRVLQDALKNVADHAQASQVFIRLITDEEYVELQIEDNGKGMTKEQLKSNSSIGFVLLKERALSIGGRAEIRTIKGKGTLVLIRVPLSR
jgi:PAS domain S-box-containing protein